MERNHAVFQKKNLVWIIGFVYILAFLFFKYIATHWIDPQLGFPVHFGGDSEQYFLLAENLRVTGVFSFSTQAPFELEALRSPGYPAFIAIILTIFRLPLFISVIQLILAAITGLLIYDIGKDIMKKSFALATAFFFWLNPTVLFYSVVMLSDILFVFIEMLAVWLIWKRKDLGSHFLAFLLLGFGALVRPAGSYLAIIIAIGLFILMLKDYSWKMATRHILISILGTILVVTPWMFRNYLAFETFRISSIGPYTLLFYDMEALRTKQGFDPETLEAKWLKELGVKSHDDIYSPIFSARTSKIFKNEVLASPLDYGIFHIMGSLRFFLLSGLSDVLTNTTITDTSTIVTLKWIERIFMALLATLMLLAPFIAWRKNERVSILLALSLGIALYMALIIGPIPNARYRLAALPFIALPAAYALQSIFEKQTFYRKRSSIK
ncbi:glycosyltransferase family 39 protein [Candidatus Microgenomates bacterium]|nr:glycosyltransferase family 39 protein [Candidatus Microgenomates bacterium]